MIVDIPNLYDQTLNAFRFSEEYYNIIKRYLMPEGIFVQIIDIINCRNDFISNTVHNLKQGFKKSIGYFFPNYIHPD